MAFSYDEIVDAMGKPDREEPLEYPANQRGRRPLQHLAFICFTVAVVGSR